MRDSDHDGFGAFLHELERESDRGLALVGAALIDEKLNETLRAFLREAKSTDELLGEGRPLSAFSARTYAAHALGLITDAEYHEIKVIRKIRNEFAHASLAVAFSTPLIHSYCSALVVRPPEDIIGAKEARSWFYHSVMWVVVRLWYRSEYVTRERRSSKDWIPPEFGSWIAVDRDEIKGLAGKTVIVLGNAGKAGLAHVVVTDGGEKNNPE